MTPEKLKDNRKRIAWIAGSEYRSQRIREMQAEVDRSNAKVAEDKEKSEKFNNQMQNMITDFINKINRVHMAAFLLPPDAAIRAIENIG